MKCLWDKVYYWFNFGMPVGILKYTILYTINTYNFCQLKTNLQQEDTLPLKIFLFKWLGNVLEPDMYETLTWAYWIFQMVLKECQLYSFVHQFIYYSIHY